MRRDSDFAFMYLDRMHQALGNSFFPLSELAKYYKIP